MLHSKCSSTIQGFSMGCRPPALVLPILVLALTLTGCASPGLARLGLAPVNPRPNMGAPGYCNTNDQRQLVVTVKNQGTIKSASSTATVEFVPGGSFTLSTSTLVAGQEIDLTPLDIPGSCWNPDCEFKITVDSGNRIEESDEVNNTASGTFVG